MRSSVRSANPNFNFYLYVTGGFILLFIAFLLRPFTVVNAGERGVVMVFGKVQERVLGEGIHTVMPVVTSVKTLNIRVKKDTFKADAASKDLQKVTTEIAVNWRIDPKKVNRVYQQIGEEKDIVDGIMTPAVSEVLKAATAKKTAEEIITKRTELKAEIDTSLKNRLVDYGVIVNDVSLVDFFIFTRIQ